MFTVIKSKRRSTSKQGCFKGVRTRPRFFDRSAARAPVPRVIWQDTAVTTQRELQKTEKYFSDTFIFIKKYIFMANVNVYL